ERLARGDGLERPVFVRERRAHEVVGRADRVVRVLELDRLPRLAVQTHVVALLAEGPGLLLFLRLAPDELAYVRVVGVENDHLRRAPRRAARLDRAGDGIGAAHERDRSGGQTATGQVLFARADRRDVDARAGAALEDDPLGLEPVEDRAHRILDGHDEAR